MGLREWFTEVDSGCECDCCKPRRVRPGSAAFASDKPEAAEVQADYDDQGDEHTDGIEGWD